MKNYKINPRTLTRKAAQELKASLDEHGDLGGIVHDLNSDEIIGGNQRGNVIDINHCHIEIVKTFDPPTPRGTVAVGWVVWQDEVFAYRQVRWTPEQCKAANIKANALGGAWDWDILANSFDASSLASWGMDRDFLHTINTDAAGLRELLYSSGEMQIPEDEWKGMPEFENDEVGTPELTIKVHFQTVDDIKVFSELIGQTVTEKSTYIWFPKQKNENLKKFRCKDES